MQLLLNGITFDTFIFCFVGFVIVKVTFVQKGYIEKNYILKGFNNILLISSLAISLNNSRMFWLFLGSLVFNLRTDVRKCKLNVANNTNNNSM